MKLIKVKNIVRSQDIWERYYRDIYSYVEDNIDVPGALDREVIFKLDENDFVRTLNITGFLTNLIMWKHLIGLDAELTEDIIFDTKNITPSDIKNYIDKNIIEKHRWDYTTKKLNLVCAEVIEELNYLTQDFGLLMGITTNIYDTVTMMRRVPEFKEILNTQEDIVGLQPKEVEEIIAKKSKRMIELLRNYDNNMRIIIESKTGINISQYNEFQINVGYKPDLDGNIFPKPINTNLYNKGIIKPSHFYMDSSCGRKALILNSKYTSSAGYLARKMDLLCCDIYLHKDPTYDCGTFNQELYDLDHPKKIYGLRDRLYKENLSDSEYCRIDPDNDMNYLLGKSIFLKSAITCSSKDGICHSCYGINLARINNDIHIGLMSAKAVSRIFTQTVLSGKHILKSNSIAVNMSQGFDDFFALEHGNIMLSYDANDINNFNLVIDSYDIEIDDEFDEGDFSKSIYEFVIEDPKRGYRINITDENGSTLYISNYLDSMITTKKYIKDKLITIPIKDIERGVGLFSISILNNELIKPMLDVKALISKKNKVGNELYCATYGEMLTKFTNIAIDANIGLPIVHFEIIIRNLIRQKDNIFELPDYSQEDIGRYQILTLHTAIMKNKSVVVTQAFERLKEQYRNIYTYEKIGSSILDELFMVNRLNKQ